MMDRIKDFLFGEPTYPQYRTAALWMWRLFAAGIVLVLVIFISQAFSDLPSVEELENPQTNEATLVLADNGEILGRYYTENRVPVSFDKLSPYLEEALVATEDIRFYEHSGIDWRGLGRAVVKTGLLGQESSGGASTITQQLAKQLFTDVRANNITKRLLQKIREWIIAVRLERKYTKQEIIAMYLNKYDFINGAQGIRAAAENYFGKEPNELDILEAATLVGMLKNASLFNPLRRPDRVLHRRMVVLKQMQKAGHLDQIAYDTLRNQPLGISFSRQTHVDGLAPYFRAVLAEEVKNILDQEPYRKADGSVYNIYRDGLRIYTTIDPNIQRHAEETVYKHMPELQKTFFRHWRNLDPWTYKSPSSKTEVSVELRQQNLVALIRNSDRYQQLRETYLLPVIREINQRHDLTFHNDDREVDRMVRESEGENVIAELKRRNLISDNLAAAYRQVMRLDAFPKLKAQWLALQEAVEKEFKEPAPMTVFAYNEKMRTDTTLTPLDSIKYHRMILQIGSMSVEPATGYVRSWVGGVNFNWFKFDHVTTPRQVGSTFKPFVYATTIDLRGFSPCFPVFDLPITIAPGDGNFNLNKVWAPRNSSGTFSGESLTLQQALRGSVNSVSVYLMKELDSPEPVRDMVSNMGIDKALIPSAPSIALGSVDLTVKQLTGAYTTFANNGVYNRPIFLKRIEDRTGRTIYTSLPEERQAINPRANYVMVHMLQNASVANLAGVKGPVGGKTGTTNDQTDGWYMGVTPNLVVGTWVGGEDRWVRFRSLYLGQGAAMAKPYFREFVKAVQNDPNISWDFDRDFYRPKGSLGIELDCNRYRGPNEDILEEGERSIEEDPFGAPIDNDPDFG